MSTRIVAQDDAAGPYLPARATHPAPPVPPPPSWPRGAGAPNPLLRYLAAVRRFKWLIAAVAALGTIGSILVARRLRPRYEVTATLWIAAENARRQEGGPIRAQELVAASGWVELLRSASLAESVVRELTLYVHPLVNADTARLRGFEAGDRLVPGTYTLSTDATGSSYVLRRGGSMAGERETVVERGAVGDSVGLSVGFRWAPMLPPNGELAFVVNSPRDEAGQLLQRLTATLPENSSFLRASLSGSDPQLTARTMNRWLDRYLVVTDQLKRRNLTEFVGILDGQLQIAETRLRDAEAALENFRVQTITLPAEGAPVAAGVEQTRDPVFQDFFRTKLEYDNIRRDRQALQAAIDGAGPEGISPDALLAIPGVLQDNDQLRSVLTELATKEAQLRTASQYYTDEYQAVVDLRAAVATLRTQTIPTLARGVLRQYRLREAQLASRVEGSSAELRRIPARTIEEMRLRREVEVAENLYTTLLSRYGEARLSEASSTPDVTVLDSAVAPRAPARNRAPQLILVGLAGSIALAVVLALLLDRFDTRLRYPEQATHELGLDIIGVVPRIRPDRRGATDPLAAARVSEAIRSIRLGLTHLRPPTSALLLTVSSPGPGDGKSLVASNLALSFAGAGYRTLLIDGDVRRGMLGVTFALPPGRGLMDYLATPSLALADVLRPTAQPNLLVVTRGQPVRHGLELLASQRLLQLMEEARARFDVVLVDTAPLGAGADAHALAVATQHLLLVLRTGETDRKLAEAKLQLLDRLPVHVVGAVLNDVRPAGGFEYYSYLPYMPDVEVEQLAAVSGDEADGRAAAADAVSPGA